MNPSATAPSPIEELLRPYAYLYAEKQLLKLGDYAGLVERLERRLRWAPWFSVALVLIAVGLNYHSLDGLVQRALSSSSPPPPWLLALEAVRHLAWLVFSALVLLAWAEVRATVRAGRLLLAEPSRQ
jgi:hypothetical protein